MVLAHAPRRGLPAELVLRTRIAELELELKTAVDDERGLVERVCREAARAMRLLEADRVSDAHQLVAGIQVAAARRVRQLEAVA